MEREKYRTTRGNLKELSLTVLNSTISKQVYKESSHFSAGECKQQRKDATVLFVTPAIILMYKYENGWVIVLMNECFTNGIEWVKFK